MKNNMFGISKEGFKRLSQAVEPLDEQMSELLFYAQDTFNRHEGDYEAFREDLRDDVDFFRSKGLGDALDSLSETWEWDLFEQFSKN